MNDTPCSRCGLRPKPIRRCIAQPSPYAAYSNGIPVDHDPSASSTMRDEIASFIRDAENELLDCDADIARFEDMLRLLKQERQDGKLLIAQHKSLLSRLHVLPPEIMLEIFRHCLDWTLPRLNIPGYSLCGRRTRTPWILSAVCGRWRSILRQSPSFWSSFASGQELRPLQHALELSRQAPLHFTHDLSLGVNLCTQALMKHASRWESVSICGPRPAFISLGDLGRLPMLRKLSISLESTWDAGSETSSDPDEIMDFTTALSPFSDCPQLDELSISMEQGLWTNQIVLQTTSLLIPWSNLSKLTVVLGNQSSHIIRSLLLVCANLRQLSVRGLNCRNFNSVPAGPTLHSGITSLTVDSAFSLLQHTEYPALTHFTPRNCTPQGFLPFLSRHCRNISHIDLNIGLLSNSRTKDWDLVLPLLPDVVHLTARIYYPDITEICSWVALSKVMGPNLRTLTLHVHCHLLDFCGDMDIIPIIQSRWSARKLQTLEIYSMRRMDRIFLRGNKIARSIPKPGIEIAVSHIIEDSAMIKVLRGFKEEGLEVNINDIPLSDQPATLYM